MLVRTEGIVLRCIKFKETSIIAHVFTPHEGIAPLLVSGVRSKKNKGKAAQFQLGHILEVVFYNKNKDGIKRLKESTIAHHFKTIPFSIIKIAQLQYFIEVTRYSIYQSALIADTVYPLLRNTLLHLDSNDEKTSNLALTYVWKLIGHLGLLPDLNIESQKYLDLRSGEAVNVQPMHPLNMNYSDSNQLNILINSEFGEWTEVQFDNVSRKLLIDKAHAFLQYHLSYFKIPRSAEMYRDILRM